MRRLVVLVVLALVPVAAYAASLWPPQGVWVLNFDEVQTRLQLVGFTSATFDGSQGVLGFSSACQVEFEGSKMCNSVELMETTSIPTELAGEAWVRPTLPSLFIGGVARDVSGASLTSNSGATCTGWSRSDTSDTGFLVDANGRFASATNESRCNTLHSVACCALVP